MKRKSLSLTTGAGFNLQQLKEEKGLVLHLIFIKLLLYYLIIKLIVNIYLLLSHHN